MKITTKYRTGPIEVLIPLSQKKTQKYERENV